MTSVTVYTKAGVDDLLGSATTALPFAVASNLSALTSAGTANAAIIQAAINAAAAAGGGEVLIPAGTFVTAPLQQKAHVTLRGLGAYATTLKLANGANTHLLTLADTSVNWTAVVDLTLDGNKANQTAGHVVYFDQGTFTGTDSSTILDDDPNHYFRRVIVRNGKQDGIHLTGSRGQAQFVSVVAYENDACGFWWESADNQFDHCISANNGVQGFFCWGAQSRLLGCKSFYNGQVDATNGDGFMIRNSRTNLVHCEAQDNRNYGFVLINVNSIIVDGMAERNGLGGSGGTEPGGTADGIYVSGVTNSRISLLCSDRNQGGLKQRWAYNAGGTNSGNMVDIVSTATQTGAIGNGDLGASSIVTASYNGVPVPQRPMPTLTTAQTGTTYTFALADQNSRVEANNASAQTYTVPPNTSVAYPVGTTLEVVQYGAGQVTLAAGAGVTLRSRGAALKTAGQYAVALLYQRAANEWVVTGDIST